MRKPFTPVTLMTVISERLRTIGRVTAASRGDYSKHFLTGKTCRALLRAIVEWRRH